MKFRVFVDQAIALIICHRDLIGLADAQWAGCYFAVKDGADNFGHRICMAFPDDRIVYKTTFPGIA
ncbi:hypothetical protein D3C86_2060030 [compost metagenome]